MPTVFHRPGGLTTCQYSLYGVEHLHPAGENTEPEESLKYYEAHPSMLPSQAVEIGAPPYLPSKQDAGNRIGGRRPAVRKVSPLIHL